MPGDHQSRMHEHAAGHKDYFLASVASNIADNALPGTVTTCLYHSAHDKDIKKMSFRAPNISKHMLIDMLSL